MLETINLRKVYRTKKGVKVDALNGVSLKFPQKGMIFLLGKSGSGKSTLLNLLGGLDKYDDGEIIIKGVSSKNFNQSHFDSYRNTYVGFIFQEYNVLEEFTVGANIALAIELQGRRADNDEVNKILREVDLEGFGDRKPNELSGGQKQRVAIARALVKNPQIIMADEPTGALDSNTGRQVFDTLKRLSTDKLVIVVSHDREFAELYGDRIIELSDGNVISDVEKVLDFEENSDNESTSVPNDNKMTEDLMVSKDNEMTEGPVASDDNEIIESRIVFNKNEMTIPKDYQLTEQDREMINEYIRNLGCDLKGKVSEGRKSKFRQTTQSTIMESDGEFKLIKSKLSLKNAFKIGVSGLKYKKIRLVVTILLSCIAFGLFGLADTFGNYDHVKTCTTSIMDSNIQYASIIKSVKQDSGISEYWDSWNYRLDDNTINKVNKDTGLNFKGVYVPKEDLTMYNYNVGTKLSENESEDMVVYPTCFSGFAEVEKKDLDKMNYKLVAGKMPDGSKDEIAISEFVYKTYEKAGYVATGSDKVEKIKKYEDFIGKKLTIGNENYTVTGIVDTGVDFERYEIISESSLGKSSAETLATFALEQELESIKSSSFACVAMTGVGRVSKMVEENGNYIELNHAYVSVINNNSNIYAERMARLSDIDVSKVTWIDSEKKELGEKELIIGSQDIIIQDKSVKADEVVEYLKDEPEYKVYYSKYSEANDNIEDGWKIVGVIDTDEENQQYSNLYVVPDKFYEKDWDNDGGIYACAVTAMPKTKNDIKNLVKYCYTEQNGVKYEMQNPVTFELDTVHEVLKVLSKVFVYIGIGFAIFAMIMLANFIATSISYKKQEIGILRAIGARSNDVFRIFFSESFVIAMINFVLAGTGTWCVTSFINSVIRENAGILITVLNFGLRQVLLLFGLSVLIAAVASFVPVYKIASKKPIDAIKNR